jgi:hypothetical protein
MGLEMISVLNPLNKISNLMRLNLLYAQWICCVPAVIVLTSGRPSVWTRCSPHWRSGLGHHSSMKRVYDHLPVSSCTSCLDQQAARLSAYTIDARNADGSKCRTPRFARSLRVDASKLNSLPRGHFTMFQSSRQPLLKAPRSHFNATGSRVKTRTPNQH